MRIFVTDFEILSQSRSNSPALTPATKAAHSDVVNVSRVDVFVSTTVTPSGVDATPTQSPSVQKLLTRHDTE